MSERVQDAHVDVCKTCGWAEPQIPAYSDDWRMEWWNGAALECPNTKPNGYQCSATLERMTYLEWVAFATRPEREV